MLCFPMCDEFFSGLCWEQHNFIGGYIMFSPFLYRDHSVLSRLSRDPSVLSCLMSIQGPFCFLSSLQGPFCFLPPLQGPFRFLPPLQGPFCFLPPIQGPFCFLPPLQGPFCFLPGLCGDNDATAVNDFRLRSGRVIPNPEHLTGLRAQPADFIVDWR